MLSTLRAPQSNHTACSVLSRPPSQAGTSSPAAATRQQQHSQQKGQAIHSASHRISTTSSVASQTVRQSHLPTIQAGSEIGRGAAQSKWNGEAPLGSTSGMNVSMRSGDVASLTSIATTVNARKVSATSAGLSQHLQKSRAEPTDASHPVPSSTNTGTMATKPSSNSAAYSSTFPLNPASNAPSNNNIPFYARYASAQRQPSPSVQSRTLNSSTEATNSRRGPSHVPPSIASHLQIPPSINSSKGSLPEFAAQLTCLFWFENSATLTLVEDARFPLPIPGTPLLPEAIPTTGFRKWVTTILSMTQVSQNVILLALMFIYRLKKLNPGVKGKVGSEFRLLTVALMLGNKFLDDNTYTNKTWADVSGISVQEIHVMEVEFLSNMRYTLYASHVEWDEWHTKLNRFSQFYDRASEVASKSGAGSPPLLLPSPHPQKEMHLSSSPASHRCSPANGRAYPTGDDVRNQTSLSLPHYLSSSNSAAASPTATTSAPATFEFPSAPWSRKRSLEDSTLEQPAKRLSGYNVGSINSSTTMTPIAMRDDEAQGWILPRPQFLQSRPTASHQTPTQSTTTLPNTRAMSSVYPPPSQHRSTPSRGPLPSIHPTQYFPPPNGAHPHLPSSSSQGQNGQGLTPAASNTSHGPAASTTPSPTAYHFPTQHTPSGLSPSGFPAPRNSPYKPIRRVNTLLVPPPSASIQRAPQQLSYDQMRYQPLGRPNSERRTGVLPLHSFYTWSDTAHQMQPQLPPPHMTF